MNWGQMQLLVRAIVSLVNALVCPMLLDNNVNHAQHTISILQVVKFHSNFLIKLWSTAILNQFCNYIICYVRKRLWEVWLRSKRCINKGRWYFRNAMQSNWWTLPMQTRKRWSYMVILDFPWGFKCLFIYFHKFRMFLFWFNILIFSTFYFKLGLPRLLLGWPSCWRVSQMRVWSYWIRYSTMS